MKSPSNTALLVLRYVLAWPRFLGWLFPVLACGLFLARDLRRLPDGVLAASWRPWFGRLWRYSMCLAAGMVFHPDAHPSSVIHEYTHMRQSEDLALAGALLAPVLVLLTGSWWAVLLWPGMLLVQLSGYLGAVLRGGHAYWDAEHERAAFAQGRDGNPDA